MKVIRHGPIFGRLTAAAILTFSLVAIDPALLAQSGRSTQHWVGTWATAGVARPQPPSGAGAPAQAPAQTPQGQTPAPQGGAPQAPNAPPVGRGGRGGGPPLNFNNQTLRQIVRTSIGGERLRVVFSNAFGTAPLPVGAARVALRDKDAAIVPKSDRVLTFGGSPSTTIAAGAVVFSDPVNLTVPPMSDLAIDLHLPADTASTTVTTHTGALQTSYVSPAGNHAGTADMPVMTTTQAWFFLARVEVMAPESTGAIVALGDSISDGTASTPGTNNRWPDHLAKRLAAQNMRMGVLNLGIAGNRVLNDGAGVSALARFDRDVLAQSGVTHVVVLEGINDFGMAQQNPPAAADLVAGHRQLIERAHARGLKIYGGTLLPFEGTAFPGYWTREKDARRQELNQWIRTSKAYDGVIDFDAAVRDPANPTKLLPKYAAADNLHLNDAGYQAMANAIDLSLFRPDAGR